MSAHDLFACLERPADFTNDEPDGQAEFWVLDTFGEGHTWLGRYAGTGPWTRHPCDVVMHTLAGSGQVDRLVDGAPERQPLDAGQVTMVNANTWYRVHSDGPVVQWGVTPGPTEHHQGDGLPG